MFIYTIKEHRVSSAQQVAMQPNRKLLALYRYTALGARRQIFVLKHAHVKSVGPANLVIRLLLLRILRGRALRVVGIKSIHGIFLVVKVMVDSKEDDTGEERGACQTNKHPHDGWVEGSGRQGLSEGRSEGVREQVHGLHERLHRWWCLGVGVLET